MSDQTIPLLSRLWLALICPLVVLFDGALATQLWRLRRGQPALPAGQPGEPEEPEDEDEEPAPPSEEPAAVQPAEPDPAAALVLLGLLQRHGRFIDFVNQEIAEFDDSDVGAAARVVHEGCRKALRGHVEVEPIRTEAEESSVEVAKGFDPSEIKLTGNVTGSAPYRGVLRHQGWRVSELSLPRPLKDHDPSIVAPAEVEL
ncbi:MAG: DUF2760 domain-containing protein [Deltaproteobacteria bacterium]|nr:DUF2760 domain-containing protein [Deltaproteobacteria bacterium]